jgi:hypothetical protein
VKKRREEDALRAVDVRKGRGAKKTNGRVSRETRTLSIFSVSLKKKPSDAVAPFTRTGHWAAGTDTWTVVFPQKRTTFSVNAALPLVGGKTTFAIPNLRYSRNMVITVGENKLL